jgi:hypothetical protein
MSQEIPSSIINEVISDGQTGADRAGWRAARPGACPTVDGPRQVSGSGTGNLATRSARAHQIDFRADGPGIICQSFAPDLCELYGLEPTQRADLPTSL